MVRTSPLKDIEQKYRVGFLIKKKKKKKKREKCSKFTLQSSFFSSEGYLNIIKRRKSRDKIPATIHKYMKFYRRAYVRYCMAHKKKNNAQNKLALWMAVSPEQCYCVTDKVCIPTKLEAL